MHLVKIHLATIFYILGYDIFVCLFVWMLLVSWLPNGKAENDAA